MGRVVLECIILVLVSFSVYYIIPFLKDKKLYEAVVIAVKAAEQIYKTSGMGKSKFIYVQNWIKNTFNVKDDDLKNIIESVVYELNKNKPENTDSNENL